MQRCHVVALSVVFAVGCADSPDDVDPQEIEDEAGELDGKADSPLAAGWEDVGLGVAYHRANAGTGVLIAYGGYSAKLSHSVAWASELVDARLGAAGIGHVFAVKGPQDAGYNAREIANTKLRAKLATFDDGVSKIYIAAHSSGSYVAHEMLNQTRRAGRDDLLARMFYANLDGGGSGLDRDLVESLGGMAFVYAFDPTLSSGLSKNHGAAKSLASAYPTSTLFEVRVPSTGCFSGAGWCLHDVVITHRPHNRNTFDLARDYTDFVDRPVTIEYFDPFLAE
jgi:hypothetical protein